MEGKSDKCSFWTNVSDCDQKTFTRQTGIKIFSSLLPEEQEKIAWRAEKLDSLNFEEAKICLHHELIHGRAFERRVVPKCCDIFTKHSKRVKGDRTISLNLARQLRRSGFNVMPGWKLCKVCYDDANKEQQEESLPGEVPMEDESCESSSDEHEDLEISKERLNMSFELAGISPVKFHGLPKRAKISTAKRKLAQAHANREDEAAKVVGIGVDEIRPGTSNESIDSEKKEKAAEFEKLMFLLKEKIQTSKRSETIKLLTLAPDSWSRKYAAEFFHVSEYLVRTARALKKEKGILAEPDPQKGKSLSKEVEDVVKLFYEDDEYSRIMPGKKDFVSIGRNIHKQKRLLLCNLSELYSAFKVTNPEISIGFSKFCSLRPKWCVTVGSSGTHTVCVCTHHQNAILLVNAIEWDVTYKDLIKKVVCDDESRECMVFRCKECPGLDSLRQFLVAELEDLVGEVINYSQWQSTDRPTLVQQSVDTDDFIELLVGSISSLTSHSYLAKSQGRFLKQMKSELERDECIVLLDFAENYKFVVQDEVQSFHWNNQMCTLHPAVIYYKDEHNKLQEKSVCILSDDNTHDTCFVHEVQRLTVAHIKEVLPGVQKVHYFSDGCAQQYKNFKNFLNLCYHKEDFGMEADWTFFATSHGKSPCDGIGGTVKRLTARASLQRPLGDQILSTDAMFEFCKGQLPIIKFEKINREEMVEVRNLQETRFEMGRTVPGTRGYHYLEPLSDGLKIRYKRTSHDPEFTGTFCFQEPIHELKGIKFADLKLMQYVVCNYHGFWWVGLVIELSTEYNDVNIQFMHPRGPTKTFYWPRNDDKCWVPAEEIVSIIETPTTNNGRMYLIADDDFAKVTANS